MRRTRRMARRAFARFVLRLPQPWAGLGLYALGMPPMAGGEDPPPDPAPTPPDPPAPDPPAVSPEDFTAMKLRAEQAEKQSGELKKWKDELEAASLSEQEKAQRERDQEKARADAAEARAERMERAGLIRAAAAKFVNPEDAVDLLIEKDIKTAQSAEREVKALADSRPHLVAKAAPSVDGLGRVIPDGTGLTAGDPTPEQEHAQWIASLL